MDRIGRSAGPRVVDEPGQRLGAQAPVDEPLLVPDGLQRACRHLGHQREDVRTSEGSEPDLRRRRRVGISGRDRCADGEKDQAGLVVRLIQRIDVDPLAQIAQIADVVRGGVDRVAVVLEAFCEASQSP